MAKLHEVLAMLCPGVEWYAEGEEIYENITWMSGTPAITKKQFTDGFAKCDAWKLKQDADQATAKASAQAKLAALGLTVEDLTALGL
jgi:hypothetical protein